MALGRASPKMEPNSERPRSGVRRFWDNLRVVLRGLADFGDIEGRVDKLGVAPYKWRNT